MERKTILAAILSLITIAPHLVAMNYNNDIFKAIRDNDITSVKKIIETNKSEINSKNEKSCSPLHEAAKKGYKEIVTLFLDRGAKINEKDNDGITPLHWVACHGQIKNVKLLLRKGAYIDSKSNDDFTPLHGAVKSGKVKIVKLLLNKGANIDSKNNWGWTPLHCTVDSDKVKIVELLLRKGAKINEKDNQGKTPLFLAKAKLDRLSIFWNEESEEIGREMVELLTQAKELEGLLVKLKTSQDKNTIAKIDKLILDEETLEWTKIKTIVELIKFGKKKSNLINRSKIKEYIKQIPFNCDSLSHTTLIEFAFNNNNVTYMDCKTIQEAVCLYPIVKAIPFIFSSEPKLYTMNVYKKNEEIFKPEHFIIKMLKQAKQINNKEFARNFFNTKCIVCLMNKNLPEKDIIQNIISFADGKFDFKEFNKKINKSLNKKNRNKKWAMLNIQKLELG